jgi:hypothetical protein
LERQQQQQQRRLVSLLSRLRCFQWQQQQQRRLLLQQVMEQCWQGRDSSGWRLRHSSNSSSRLEL